MSGMPKSGAYPASQPPLTIHYGGGGDGKTLKVKRSADTGERDAEQTKQQVSITDSQPEKFLDYYLKTIKHKRFAGA